MQQFGGCVQQALEHVEGTIVVHGVALQHGCRGPCLLQDSGAHSQSYRIAHWRVGTNINATVSTLETPKDFGPQLLYIRYSQALADFSKERANPGSAPVPYKTMLGPMDSPDGRTQT